MAEPAGHNIACLTGLAAVFAVITGMVGALFGKLLFDNFRIPTDATGWAVRGFALLNPLVFRLSH